MAAESRRVTGTDYRRVTCSECGKRSEIIAPPDDATGDVIWRCPSPLENGIDQCGARNVVSAS